MTRASRSFGYRPAALAAPALLAGVLLAGCAAPPPRPGPAVVPALQVRVGCADCRVRQAVPQLIVDGYLAAAAAAGATVRPEPAAMLTIVGYADRPDGARLMLGVFAGEDRIRAVVDTAEGRRFEVEDNYRNAWLGIEALARKVGRLTFEGLTAGR